jgi:hypothetical protein
MNTVRMGEFPVQVSLARPADLIVMVVDGASLHKANDLTIPANSRLLALPPYAPELTPQEHVRDEVREKEFPNRGFNHLDAVIRELEQGTASAGCRRRTPPQSHRMEIITPSPG